MLPDRIELSTSPLPMVRLREVRNRCAAGTFHIGSIDCTDFARVVAQGFFNNKKPVTASSRRRAFDFVHSE